jgi:hypothetical protein
MFTFTRLFERSSALGRHTVGPFAEERSRFLQHSSELGMSRSSLRHAAEYLLGAENYLRLADNPGKRFTLDEIEAAGNGGFCSVTANTLANGGNYTFRIWARVPRGTRKVSLAIVSRAPGSPTWPGRRRCP